MKIIAKAKGINLTPRTKPKKEDKYKETSESEYKFPLAGTAIYNGFSNDYKEYRGLECTILKRNRRKNTDYYLIKFEDNKELKDIAVGFLKTQDEYNQWLLDQEEGNDEMSDIEKAIIDAGLIPHKNRKSCLNPPYGDKEMCHKCCHENRCIYINKYNYAKMKF